MSSPSIDVDDDDEQEGVIKYQLTFNPGATLPSKEIAQLIHWHHRLHTRGLIGRDPERYGGLAFGNLSQRLVGGGFAISGTQTADIPAPTAAHFAQIIDWCCKDNHVTATGPIQPSSESLTHAALYAENPEIRYIFHVHSPEIWRLRERLKLPTTAADIPYGTPAMATEVAHLYQQMGQPAHGVIAMGGHEDGIIGFGQQAEQAGQDLLSLLVSSAG